MEPREILARLSARLPQAFVYCDAHNGGEVQTARSGGHRQSDAVFRAERLLDPVMDLVRHTVGFLPKQQIIADRKFGLPVRAIRFCRVQAETFRLLAFQERLPALVLSAIDEVPVVQAGPTPGFFRHVETDRMNDVQSAAARRRGAPDISCVVGNLRIQQHDVKMWLGHDE